MSRRRMLIQACVAVAVALFAVGGAQAQPAAPDAPKGRGDGPQHGRHERGLKERLGLSDGQVKQIREIHQREASSLKPIVESIRKARTELRQLALAGGDDAALKAKMAEIERSTTQMLELRVKTLREIGPILTPEQREKLAKMEWGPERSGRGRPPAGS